MSNSSLADRIALYAGTGLVLLGTVVIGILEMIGGSTHPVSGEGQIQHEALVPLEIRSYIIIAGLLIWAGYAVYKFVLTTPESSRPGQIG
jgi:hypothetical protein